MRRALVVTVLLAGGLFAWRAHRADAPDGKLLFGRFWIDHQPRSPKEQFQALFVNDRIPFGHFAVRDAWEAHVEFFHYHVVPKEDGVIDFLYGKTNENHRVRYLARPCNEQGFDYCLDISGTSRGVHRYYSKKEWSTDAVDVMKR